MKTMDLKIKKPADTRFNIIDFLKERWSPREFSNLPVSNQDLRVLLEAGRWSPSSHNMQPWYVIWGVQGDGTYERIFECLDEFNQQWADNAPVLMILAYDKEKPNGDENFHALYDLGQFAMSMTIQAQSMGIAVHQMAGLNFDKAKSEFQLPKNFHVASALSIGHYGGKADELSSELLEDERSEKRERKSQNEFAFNGNYIHRAEL